MFQASCRFCVAPRIYPMHWLESQEPLGLNIVKRLHVIYRWQNITECCIITFFSRYFLPYFFAATFFLYNRGNLDMVIPDTDEQQQHIIYMYTLSIFRTRPGLTLDCIFVLLRISVIPTVTTNKTWFIHRCNHEVELTQAEQYVITNQHYPKHIKVS